ncbi:iron complex transport system substrate-binding protein [Mariprofundus micogutta]|uniref:Iron complex transport system substrate-binding protein n=1 Tax=Mariprofundus micogutta TaxID=1921010 RepID=A0A1L8CL21_9PROT|nr:helical backbone metal receptor [Mariprofundus micogutta]GAV19617.1 iron complex transport system substrate-binding protein [Mariprofundus micogutta]
MLLTCLSVGSAWAGERILALSPHACEMLYAIGAGDEVVGVSEYCDFPDAVKNRPVIANYSRLYHEAALRLKPTLLIASNASLKGLETARQHGALIVVTHPENLQDIFDDLHRLGEQTGHASQATLLVGQLQTRLAEIKAKTDTRHRVFFEVWSDPLMTEAGNSFITQVLDAAGGDNVFSGNNVETMRVNIEAVIRAKPAVIIIPNRSGNIESRKAFWKQWLPTAYVIAINPDLISRPSPRIVEGIAQLQQQLDQIP